MIRAAIRFAFMLVAWAAITAAAMLEACARLLGRKVAR